jgi:phosphoribosylformylglycinamidine cyclo-ligase
MVKEIDMSGTALGWLPRGEQLDGRSITPGDVVIGLPSSGIHSNGFSLARKVLDRSGLRLKDLATFIPSSHPSVRAGHTLWRHTDDVSAPVSVGEVLLNPTQIYVDPLVDMFRSMRNGDGPCPYGALRGIAHITGGGLSNLLRLHPTVGFHISSPLRPLPEFEWMQRVGSISNYEMYRTFNMGMGMAIVVSAEDADALAVWLSSKMPGAQVVGFVNTSGTVTHSLPDVIFDKY